jgi:hypothetical protein
MNLKTKALGLVAALGLSLSIVTPSLAVDTTTDTGDIEVTLNETGEFVVSITGAQLTNPVGVTATTGGTSSGTLTIDYKDTKSFRNAFWVTLSASDFESDNIRVPASRPNAGLPYKIAASNLKVTHNYNVKQGRWSSWALGAGNLGYAIGDIGATSNGNDRDSSSGPFTSSDADGSYHNWSSVPNNTLDVGPGKDAPTVGLGFAGPGTAGPFPPTHGSTQLIKVALTVPAGQPADTYTSTLTVSVVPPGP